MEWLLREEIALLGQLGGSSERKHASAVPRGAHGSGLPLDRKN